MSANNEVNPLQVQIIAVAITMTNVILAGVLYGLNLSGTIPEEPAIDVPITIAGPVGLGIAIVMVAISFVMKQAILANRTADQSDAQRVFSSTIVALALCDAGSCLGFVLGFLTGSLEWAFGMMGIATAGCVLHFPTARAFR